MSTGDLGTYFQHLQEFTTWRWEGSVTKVAGQVVESEGPVCSVGEACEIVDKEGNSFPGEIVGFRGPNVLSMPLDKPSGIRYGDKIYTWGSTPAVGVGVELLGRVVDGNLKPIDNFGPCRPSDTWHLDHTAPSPMDRVHPPGQGRLGPPRCHASSSRSGCSYLRHYRQICRGAGRVRRK